MLQRLAVAPTGDGPVLLQAEEARPGGAGHQTPGRRLPGGFSHVRAAAFGVRVRPAPATSGRKTTAAASKKRTAAGM